MPNPASSIRDTQEQAAQHAALGVLCPPCSPAAKSPFDGLPRWPEATHTMLAGAHQARPDDEDDDDGKFADKPRAGKIGKNEDEDEDDGDEDRPRPKKRTPASSGAGAAAAGAGIGIGMILLIVGGVAGCCVCVPAILVGLLVPAVQKVREAAVRAQASNNAKEISMACQSFHDMNRFLPSPRMQPRLPQNISPELSWRVSILPYLGNGPLEARFDMNQGWDGPKNRPLMSPMPMPYGHPADAVKDNTQTKFQYFTGPGTLFPNPLQKVALFDIKDGSSNTFLFAEAATPVPWSKPADMAVGIGPLPLPEDKFIAAMADGMVRIVNRRSASDEVLRQIINPNDGKFGPPGWGD
jgi:hypothetical protein